MALDRSPLIAEVPEPGGGLPGRSVGERNREGGRAVQGSGTELCTRRTKGADLQGFRRTIGAVGDRQADGVVTGLLEYVDRGRHGRRPLIAEVPRPRPGFADRRVGEEDRERGGPGGHVGGKPSAQ